MRLVELQQALRAADPAAVLVSGRVLDHIVQQVGNLPNLIWNIPHRKCIVVDRPLLFRHVEQEDLDLEPDQPLPHRVILLARPPGDRHTVLERERVLLKYWRRLFHAKVHQALEARVAEGALGPDAVRARSDIIGQSEFDEIRTVLSEDNYLLPQADDLTVYIEFAAVYLELRYFAAHLLPGFFPGLRDRIPVEAMLSQDVDAAALFAQTRLTGAPDPVIPPDHSSDESHEYYWSLVHSAERACKAGNHVRAAILRIRASRVAPGGLTLSTRNDAEADVLRLTKRLQAALQLSDLESADWTKDLTPLLEKADQGSNPVEARLLYDLQKVCMDSEREIYALDVVEWFFSGGKRPIQRPLSSQRLVRVIQHLQSATGRLAATRLSDADRQHLARLLQDALRRSEEQLRTRFRPVLAAALQDVGLNPTNPPERTAFQKIIEEILDRIIAQGFLTFGDLRDTISRNQLKLADLSDAQDFIRGDALLRLDRRLGNLLDGVYRPSEIYMRMLERVTALKFGTTTGRLLTRFVTLPFGAAFLILQILGLLLGFAEKLHTSPALHTVKEVLQGPWYPEPVTTPETLASTIGLAAAPHEAAPLLAVTSLLAERTLRPRPSPAWHFLLLLALGLFLLGLLESESFRRRVYHRAAVAYAYLRRYLIEVPIEVLPLEQLHQVYRSWPFQLLYWYVLKPVAGCALLWLVFPEAFFSKTSSAVAFLLISVLLNSRVGRGVSEALSHAAGQFVELLRAGLLPGLVRLIVQVFKQLIDAIEYVLFTVDEWLRFRSGDSRLSLVVRTVLGALWFPISYLLRFYTVVLIEPGFNPLKAPVSYLAAKFLLPFYPFLTALLAEPLVPLLGERASYTLVFFGFVFWTADAFGFLFWEMKENWSLFRANRPRALRPVAIGSHGETLRGLLQPGFHSGTVPRLYARLRRAEREAAHTGNWRAVRTYRHELEEVAKALQRFVARELVALVQQSTSWQGQKLEVGRVEMATNQIRIELLHGHFPGAAVWIEFEYREGWLVAGLQDTGWLDKLAPEPSRALTAGLASLYKLAGVDLVREQVRASLPPNVAAYDVTAEGLRVWPTLAGPPLRYDLHEPDGTLRPRYPDGTPADGPVLDTRRLVFARAPLYWQQWLESWQKDQDGQGYPSLLGPEVDLVPVSHPADAGAAKA
jgi:hypothetical protein